MNVEAAGAKLADEQQRLLDELAHLPSSQAAWLLLLYCAAPRANYTLRTVPPAQALPYARKHDQGLLEAFHALLALGAEPSPEAGTSAVSLRGMRPPLGRAHLPSGVRG